MSTTALFLATLIFFAAALYSTVGHAGASGYLAAMALFGLAPEVMRPTALALNILVASLAVYRFSRAGQNDWRLLLPFAVASIPAAFVGGLVRLPPDLYRPVVGAVLVYSAWRFARRAGATEGADSAVRRPPVPVALGVGVLLGLLAGLTGTGGGIFLSPLLLFMGWADTRRASGVAATFILINSIAALAGTTVSIGLLPTAFPLWALAALAGGLIGTELGTRRLPVPWLRHALAVVLVIAGGKMLVT